VSRELQRQLKRIAICLPRPAKTPPRGPGWIHESTTASAFLRSATARASPCAPAGATRLDFLARLMSSMPLGNVTAADRRGTRAGLVRRAAGSGTRPRFAASWRVLSLSRRSWVRSNRREFGG
jgi:hypothetical protein